MSQVNLLPPDILQRQKVRQLTFAVMAVGVAVLVVIAGFFLLQGTRLAGVNRDIANQNRNNAAISQQINALQQYANLGLQAQAKLNTLQAAYAYEASFSSMLEEISQIIPSDQYLTTLNIQITPPVASTAGGPVSNVLIGSMKFQGLTGQLTTLASWLTRSDAVPGWANAWFTTASRDSSTGLWTFNSSIDLTPAVLTARGRKAIG